MTRQDDIAAPPPENLETRNDPVVVVMWMLLLILGIGLLISIYFFNHYLRIERKTEKAEVVYIQQATTLENGVYYLINAAREFAMTGNPDYLQDYWYEADITRSRDQVITYLNQLKLPESEKALLITAKRNSDALMTTETRAMKLVLLAINVPEQDMYPPVRDYRLLSTDISLPAIDKINLAQKILFDHAYMNDRASVLTPIDQFQEVVNKRAQQETRAASIRTDNCLFAVGTLTVLILILLFSLVWLHRGKLS